MQPIDHSTLTGSEQCWREDRGVALAAGSLYPTLMNVYLSGTLMSALLGTLRIFEPWFYKAGPVLFDPFEGEEAVHEFDMKAGDAVRTRALAADDGYDRNIVPFARDPYK